MLCGRQDTKRLEDFFRETKMGGGSYTFEKFK